RDGRRQRLPLPPLAPAVRRVARRHPPGPHARAAGGHGGAVAVAPRGRAPRFPPAAVAAGLVRRTPPCRPMGPHPAGRAPAGRRRARHEPEGLDAGGRRVSTGGGPGALDVTLPDVVSRTRPRRAGGRVRSTEAYAARRVAWATVVARAVAAQGWGPPARA